MDTSLLTGRQFMVRKKLFKLLGSDFRVFDESQRLVMFAHMKAFKWKEDIMLYRDDTKTEPVIRIRARNIIDFSAAYDFTDAQTGQKFGAAKRHGWKSMFRDEWTIMDTNDVEIGRVKEDSALLAFVRRFLSNLVPQTFHAHVNGESVVTYKNNFNPIISKVNISIDKNTELFSIPFAISLGILLCAIEGKQQ